MRSSLLTLAALAATASAYEFIFYTGREARSQNLGRRVFGPGQGCKSGPEGDVFIGNAQSVIVKSTGAVDDNFIAVIFESDDCNPNKILAMGDEEEGRILNGGFLSMEVWDLSDVL